MANFVRPLNLKKPIVNRKLIAWAFILSGLISVGSWFWGKGDSWWGAVKISYPVQPQASPTPATGAIVAQLQTQLATASGSWGIYIYRLDGKLGYGLSADKVYPAASIMKVPMMVAGYRQVENGSLKLEEIEELLRAMGKRSDNEAPATLIGLVGRPFMRQTVNDLGMTNTNFDQNVTTAYDVAAMWKNLSAGKLISPDHWRQMQEFLTSSIFEERIPAGVPDGVRVVHKVGTDVDVWADSGIIMTARPFVVAILNERVNLEEARRLVPQLVQTIWTAETAVLQ